MTPQSKKILAEMQVRKSKARKAAFREWLCHELEGAGYAPVVEESRLGPSRNVVAGDPERAWVLLTAHYDTQAVLPIPNFITPRNFLVYCLYQTFLCLPLFLCVPLISYVLAALLDAPPWVAVGADYALLIGFFWYLLDGKANKHTANDNTSGVVTLLETALALPAEDRDKVCFVFFDNEEKGMLGSAAFAKRHKKAKKEKLVLNLDCVSDGDYIQFFPSKALKQEPDILAALEAAFQSREGKRVEVVRGFGFYPSDNASFRRGVGVCALKHRSVVGYYLDRIHTGRDTCFDEKNITLLRDGLLALVSAWAGEEKEGD